MAMLTYLLSRRPLARVLLKPVLRLHSLFYKLSGDMAVAASPAGQHPKHGILKYKEWFLDHIREDWTVVDIGCNTGAVPYLLAQKARQVIGIEINGKLLREAREKRSRPNIQYIEADATKHELAGQQADCITLSNVLEHIEKRVDFLVKIVAQLHWRDSAEKRLLIRVPVIERDWISVFKKEMGVDYRLDPTHFTEYTVEQFRGEMRDAGIEILELERRFDEIYAVCRAR